MPTATQKPKTAGKTIGDMVRESPDEWTDLADAYRRSFILRLVNALGDRTPGWDGAAFVTGGLTNEELAGWTCALLSHADCQATEDLPREVFDPTGLEPHVLACWQVARGEPQLYFGRLDPWDHEPSLAGDELVATVRAALQLPYREPGENPNRNEAPRAEGDELEVPVGDVLPSKTNPRLVFDPEFIARLADSVKRVGVLQPLVVRPHLDHAGKYELAAGEQRLRAAKKARLKTVPVRVRDLTDEEFIEIQVLENLDREQLNPIEKARGYRNMIDLAGYSERTLAKRLSLSQAHIANTVGLLRLPEDWQQRVISQEITATHARHLVAWADVPAVLKEAAEGLKNKLKWSDACTVADFERIVNRSAADAGRPISGEQYLGSRGYLKVRLSKKDREREDLLVREVKHYGKRAFNTELWEELQKAGEERAAERERKKAGGAAAANGKAGKAAGAAAESPEEKRRKTEQRKQQRATQLYRYKIGWLQRAIAGELRDADDDDMLRLLLLLALKAARGLEPDVLGPLIRDAGGRVPDGLYAEGLWKSLATLSADGVHQVVAGALDRWLQMPPDYYRSPLLPGDVEAIAKFLGIEFDRDWQVEPEWIELQTKGQLEALAKEWGLAAVGTKRGEIAENLLKDARAANVSCPKELAKVKPQLFR